MRKKFVFYVLIPAVVLCLVVVLFIDRWVAAGLEYAGEKAAGAKVEIDGVHVSLAPLGIRWAHMQVADRDDPWRNIFETGTVRFAVDFGQLLRNKYIIQTMEVNDLILGTKRTTDGSIPRPPAVATAPSATAPGFGDRAEAPLAQSTGKSASPGKSSGHINTDSLLRVLDIRALKHLDSLKQQALAASQQWNPVLADFETSKTRLAQIETAVTAINPSQLTSVPAITSAISTVDNATKELRNISGTFNARKASIQNDVQALTASAGATETIAADDFARLKSMAKLPNMSTAGIAGLIAGGEMAKKAAQYLHWIDVARAEIKNSGSSPGYETPPRMKGQDIRFPLEHAYPKFWIEKVLVSGGKDSAGSSGYIRAQGEVDNITNDQSVTRVPLTAALRGIEGNGRSFTLNAKFDRTGAVPYDEYAATLEGVPLAAFAIGKEDFLAATMVHARMNSAVKAVAPGNAIDVHAKTVLTGFSLQFASEPTTTLERIIREVLQGINEFEVNIRLWSTGGRFDVALSTDLDSKIEQRVSGALGAELTRAQDSLKSKFDAALAPKKAEVEHLVADKCSGVEKQLATYESLVNGKLAMLDAKQKELTDRLEKQQKGKVQDVLKGILKK